MNSCIFCDAEIAIDELWCQKCDGKLEHMGARRSVGLATTLESLQRVEPLEEFEFGFYRNLKRGTIYHAKRWGWCSDNADEGWRITYFLADDVSERLPFFCKRIDFLEKFERVQSKWVYRGDRALAY